MSRNSFLSVLVLSGLGFLAATTQAAEAPRSRTQIDSLRKAADRAQKALIDAERMADAKPETIIVATRKPGRPVKVDLGKRGVINIDTEGSHGDKVLMGDDLTVAVGEVVGGDAVSIGGDITVLGKVTGDVVSVGGDVTLGDSSFVGGDAVSVGGSVDRSESAIVVGKVVEVDGPDFGDFPPWKEHHDDNFGSRFMGLILTIIFFMLLFAAAALTLYLARQRIEYASDYLLREPIPSLLLGLLSPLLLLLALIFLFITCIGWLLMPALLILYPAFLFIGWVVAGHRIGRSIQAGETPLRTVFTGLVILSGLLLLISLLNVVGVTGFFRFIVIFTGLTISSLGAFAGLGAILGTRFRRAPLLPVAPAATEPIPTPAPLPTPEPPIA